LALFSRALCHVRREHLSIDPALRQSPTALGGLYKTAGDLYNNGMTSMTMSAARQNLPDAVDKARTEPVILERYGRAAAVLVSPEHYARLVAALEDAEDAEAFDAAIAEEGPNIPWDQAKADLGWE
jgi:antitoxin Phd